MVLPTISAGTKGVPLLIEVVNPRTGLPFNVSGAVGVVIIAQRPRDALVIEAEGGVFSGPEGLLGVMLEQGDALLEEPGVWRIQARFSLPEGWSGHTRIGGVNVLPTAVMVATLSLAVTQSTPQWRLRGGSSLSGWTVLVPSVDTRKVYVSDSIGNDQWDGLYAEFSGGTIPPFHGPKKTIGAAISGTHPNGGPLLRNGFPDWLNLRRGDTFNNQNFATWTKSGRSATERMVICAYDPPGTTQNQLPCPIVVYPPGACGPPPANQAGIVFNGAKDVAIVDIEWKTVGGVTCSGVCVNFGGGAQRILVEGNKFTQGYQPIVSNGASDIAIRRSLFLDCGKDGGYFINSANFLFEENIFDNIRASSFAQGIYSDNENNSGFVLRRNIFLECYNAFQLRNGGIAEDNFFARCAVSLGLGSGDSW